MISYVYSYLIITCLTTLWAGVFTCILLSCILSLVNAM